MKDVDETHNTNIHDDSRFAAIVAREQRKELHAMYTTEKNEFKTEMMIEGRGRSWPFISHMELTRESFAVSSGSSGTII